MTTIFRSATKGCWRQVVTPFGQYLAPARDPLADGELPDEALQAFELHENPPRIPAELWSAWIKLCFHFVTEANDVEVGCRILRHATEHDRWRILIPEQRVSGASVHVDSCDGAMDLITGEVIKHYPPEGWEPIGTSHSHNTMAAYFSGVDDSTELGDPGLHIVVGSINTTANTYALRASITARMKRFDVPFDKVIDTTPAQADFHPAVLTIVDHVTRQPSFSSWSLGKGTYGRTWNEKEQRWEERPQAALRKRPGSIRRHELEPDDGLDEWEQELLEYECAEGSASNALDQLHELFNYHCTSKEDFLALERVVLDAHDRLLDHWQNGTPLGVGSEDDTLIALEAEEPLIWRA